MKQSQQRQLQEVSFVVVVSSSRRQTTHAQCMHDAVQCAYIVHTAQTSPLLLYYSSGISHSRLNVQKHFINQSF